MSKNDVFFIIPAKQLRIKRMFVDKKPEAIFIKVAHSN